MLGWPPKKDGIHIHGQIVEMTPQKAKEISERAENTFVIILPDGIRYQLSEDHRFADSCDRLSRYIWIIPFKDTAEERAVASIGAPVPPCLKP